MSSREGWSRLRSRSIISVETISIVWFKLRTSTRIFSGSCGFELAQLWVFRVLLGRQWLDDWTCSHRLGGLPSSSGSPSLLHLRALAPETHSLFFFGRERSNLNRPLTPVAW